MIWPITAIQGWIARRREGQLRHRNLSLAIDQIYEEHMALCMDMATLDSFWSTVYHALKGVGAYELNVIPPRTANDPIIWRFDEDWISAEYHAWVDKNYPMLGKRPIGEVSANTANRRRLERTEVGTCGEHFAIEYLCKMYPGLGLKSIAGLVPGRDMFSRLEVVEDRLLPTVSFHLYLNASSVSLPQSGNAPQSPVHPIKEDSHVPHNQHQGNQDSVVVGPPRRRGRVKRTGR